MKATHAAARLTLLLLTLAPGCGSVHSQSGAGSAEPGRLITEEQIGLSRARNAWEVLQRGDTRFALWAGGAGQTAQIPGRHPNGLAEIGDPLVVVDGAVMLGIDILRDILAHRITSIRVVTGIEATRHYGARAGNGAIVIRTRQAPHR